MKRDLKNLENEMEKLQEDKTYLYDKNSDLQKEIKELENQNADFIQHVEDRYNIELRLILSILRRE